MKTIAEHTFDETLIGENSKVLDIGCRGMEFINHFEPLCCDIFAIDIEKVSDQVYFYHCAISNYNGYGSVQKSDDEQATKLIKTGDEIRVHTLPSFMKLVDVGFFDLIKIDCEGSEYDIIISLEKAPAKQLSIEFHLHTGAYGMDQMREMETKLYALGYETIQHELSERHGAGKNYWDSLFKSSQ